MLNALTLPSQRFSKQLRLNKAADFKAAFQNGKKLATRYLAVFATPNDLSYPRLGTVVGKKAVNKAVARHRIKRAVRESFRLHQHLLGNVDLVVVAYHGINTLNKAELRPQIDQQWERLPSYKNVSGS